MKILTVGTVAFDAIESPFGKVDKIIGGAATYISWSASYYTKDLAIVSVIGGDYDMESLDRLRARGVDTSGLEIKEDEKSFFWSGRYHTDMNTRDSLDTQLNVLLSFDPKVPANHRDAEILMLGNIDPALQMKVIDQMNNPAFIVLDTMNFWMEIKLDALKEVIKRVNLLTINDEEARLLTGEYSLKKASKKILAMGPQYLIIKKGEHGALLFSKDDMFFAPALPLEDVFDPTGAGDTFAGGLVGYLAQHEKFTFEELKKGVIHGSMMASFCVESFGPQRLMELNDTMRMERLEEFRKLTKF